ncbi:hypothetical protein HW555_002503 [Spodoptera exigua]|uniref:FLYWCH-type domain-containing protein n=1 Tax=Spodoptera exigua TaxID=7107 RepID=A0A835GQQ1_SPOEX|nr:hypothetical protein HW555_002503 [Spodoptera exigua]
MYKSGKSIWRCKRYKDNKCAGSVTLTTDLHEILQSKPHSTECKPNDNQNTIDVMINNSCEEAASGKEPAPRAFNRDEYRLRGGVLAMCGVTIVLLLLLVICAIILHRQKSRRFTVVDENHH